MVDDQWASSTMVPDVALYLEVEGSSFVWKIGGIRSKLDLPFQKKSNMSVFVLILVFIKDFLKANKYKYTCLSWVKIQYISKKM